MVPRDPQPCTPLEQDPTGNLPLDSGRVAVPGVSGSPRGLEPWIYPILTLQRPRTCPTSQTWKLRPRGIQVWSQTQVFLFQRPSLFYFLFFLKFFPFYLLFGCVAYRTLVSRPGIEPGPPALAGMAAESTQNAAPFHGQTRPKNSGLETPSWPGQVLERQWVSPGGDVLVVAVPGPPFWELLHL